MSAQSPTPMTPKGPRNARRNPKRITTPSTQNTSTLATPPSSPPKEAATDSSGTITLSKKKGSRSAKKPRDGSKTSPVSKSGNRHTSSHANNAMTTPHLKDTRYAGPTFHASPAPSALPIPSFFSKSFPESDLPLTVEHDSDSFEVDADIENTPSKSKSRPLVSQGKQESTPLDFLFQAAVEARKSHPQHSPERSPSARFPQTDSKPVQYRKFNNNNINGMSSPEMGAPHPDQPQIGPSFAPSYKDRMNALRSASSPSPKMQDLDEEQRKAKTEALKKLLLNPRPQRPSSISQANNDQTSYKQERQVPSPMIPHFATPLRTSSGPPSMSCHRDIFGKPTPSESFSHPGPAQPQFNSPQRHRLQETTPGSGVLASNPGNVPGAPRQSYGSPLGAYSPAKAPAHQQHSNNFSGLNSTNSHAYQNPTAGTNSPAADTKRMEDDLRRILKLDVNPSIPSSGIQSSLA